MAAKYLQIKKHILAKIESGQWQENDPVPSENKLAEDFLVSRMTARRALEELSQQGLLIRTKGAGTFVASLKSQGSMFEIRDIADEIRERGHVYQATQIKLDQVRATASIAISLDLPVGDLVAHSIIVHQENGKPMQLEERFVNSRLAPGYLSQDFNQTSPHEYLCRVAPLTEAQHTIEAISPSNQVCAWLKLSNQEPCLQLTRKTSSNSGVVSFAQIIYPGSSYRLSGLLTFNKTNN